MKKNATTKTKKGTKSTGKLLCKKSATPKTQKTTKTSKGNPSKTAKNTPKKARERVTVSNYQRLAMRTCLPQCKCWEYAIPELLSEWHEALAKIEGTRAKLVRLDGNASVKEWHSKKIQDIKEELGDVFWSLALICELKKQSFEDIFRTTPASEFDGFSLDFWYVADDQYETVSDKIVASHIKYLKCICRCMGIKASDCLEANIRKLSKRQAENKIQGDGDKR